MPARVQNAAWAHARPGCASVACRRRSARLTAPHAIRPKASGGRAIGGGASSTPRARFHDPKRSHGSSIGAWPGIDLSLRHAVWSASAGFARRTATCAWSSGDRAINAPSSAAARWSPVTRVERRSGRVIVITASGTKSAGATYTTSTAACSTTIAARTSASRRRCMGRAARSMMSGIHISIAKCGTRGTHW